VIFSLDSNVLVDAIRQPSEMVRYRAFLEWALPQAWISAVVLAELRAGAKSAPAIRIIDDQIVGRFERHGRIAAPTVAQWDRAGAVMSADPTRTRSASRQNDILLALQARERGWVLITRDADFLGLREQIPGLQLAAPYPKR